MVKYAAYLTILPLLFSTIYTMNHQKLIFTKIDPRTLEAAQILESFASIEIQLKALQEAQKTSQHKVTGKMHSKNMKTLLICKDSSCQ